jgi:hypothetical protein
VQTDVPNALRGAAGEFGAASRSGETESPASDAGLRISFIISYVQFQRPPAAPPLPDPAEPVPEPDVDPAVPPPLAPELALAPVPAPEVPAEPLFPPPLVRPMSVFILLPAALFDPCSELALLPASLPVAICAMAPPDIIIIAVPIRKTFLMRFLQTISALASKRPMG